VSAKETSTINGLTPDISLKLTVTEQASFLRRIAPLLNSGVRPTPRR
jgi:hypothetical protein